MNKKIVFVAGIIVILVLSAIFFAGKEDEAEKESKESAKETNLLLMQRESYGISSAVFSELPVPPSDFNKIVSLFHQGKFSDELFFSEKYFSQPEFYPSFLGNGLNYWQNPSTTHYGAYGYGSYPIKKTVVIKAGEKIKAKFFVHSGYGVRSFQGIQLNAVTEYKNFFLVSIKDPVFLLEPNFPKFRKEWAKEVELNIEAKEKTPEGMYEVKVFVSSPPEEFSYKWSKEHEKYFDAAEFSTGKELYELKIIVE
ncbi:MAG: hypothetical protein ABH986_06520 [archaeon]